MVTHHPAQLVLIEVFKDVFPPDDLANEIDRCARASPVW